MTEQSPAEDDVRRERFLRALKAGPQEIPVARLEAYVAAQLAGEDYRARFPDLAEQLDASPEAAAAYALLYELMAAEAAGELPLPDQIPPADLSFLRSHERQITALRDHLQRAGRELILQLSQELVTLFQPPPAMAPATRESGERYAQVLWTIDGRELSGIDLPLTLTAYRDAQQPRLALVEVRLAPPGKSWPDLAGYEVTVVVEGNERQATTDAWGVAAFADVPLAALAQITLRVPSGE